MLNFKEVINKI